MKLVGKENDQDSNISYRQAHGTVMIVAWIVFGSSAVLFARYGRKLRFGPREKLLGESIWFQFHRFNAVLVTITTLLGFFLILVHTGATWTGSDEGLAFVHSILGGIIVTCALVQAWMALFRCHPESSYRFIYNWLHGCTGLLAFSLSIPALFLIIIYLDKNRTASLILLSLWTLWTILIVLILESIRIRRQIRLSEAMTDIKRNKLYYLNQQAILRKQGKHEPQLVADSSLTNKINILLIVMNFFVTTALSIPLIFFLW